MDGMIKHIRHGLYNDTNLYVVDTDSNHKKPKYPFISYKVTSFLLDNNQAGAVFNDELTQDVEETMYLDSKITLSVNAYSNDLAEANNKALRAWEWFKFRGKPFLKDKNIVVVRTSNVQDRTLYIVDNYEYRSGFDVELRFLHGINRITPTIETYKIEGGMK